MNKLIVGFVVSSTLGISGNLLLAQEVTPTSPTQPDTQMQAQHAPHMVDPSAQAQHMAKRLKLSSDQQTQVLNILTAQRDQISSLRGDSSVSRADRRSRVQAVRTDSESKIRALLNDDQKQAFDQMQQQHAQRLQNRKG